MKRAIAIALLAGATAMGGLVAAPAAMADSQSYPSKLTIYTDANFGGDSESYTYEPSFFGSKLDNKVSSMSNFEGTTTWTLFKDGGWRGASFTLAPGTVIYDLSAYPGWNDVLSSAEFH